MAKHTKYSFDDTFIGTLKASGQSLDARLIPRPPDLTLAEWYKHAGAVCHLLNKEAERA